ncbi:MAG TPA: universal stress protein [Vicinamibacteria bacterium]|jgi:nucleotide-binding universal stress UspA family protein
MAKIDIRRVLCPTDFSAFSARAFEHAVAMAAWHEARLTVLHILPDTVVPSNELAYMGNPMLLERGRSEDTQSWLADVVAPACRAGLHVDGEVREGKPAGEIVRAAQDLGVDLIVMGTHGRSGFQRWVLGSVTEKVLRQAPCPVLTVSARGGEGPRPMFFKRILCATDFSPASEAGVGYAGSLAVDADACLLLVHVLDRAAVGAPSDGGADGDGRRPEFECAARAQLRRALPPEVRQWCMPEEIVTRGKVAPEILRLAAERQVDLVVMGVHGRSLLDLMAFGSMTHEVVREAACPVLTVRPSSR